MAQYSKEEIEAFEAKDLRISKAGILQALIQSGLFTKDEVIADIGITATTEMYRRWIWGEDKIEVSCGITEPSWEVIAQENKLPIPTEQQKDILEKICDSYDKQEHGVQTFSLAKLMSEIIRKHGRYPTKESSVSIVVGSISLTDLLN